MATLRPIYYTLDGTRPVPCWDIEKITAALPLDRREVAYTIVDSKGEAGGHVVSTVFLAKDSSPLSGDPHLFESMVFAEMEDDPWHQRRVRCRTWEEAVAGHFSIVNALELGQVPEAVARA